MKFTLTEEQKKAIKLFKGGTPKLCIEAKAGASKSFTIKECCCSSPERSYMILAFNDAIAKEMARSIKSHAKSKGIKLRNVEAKTWHSLAWRYVVTPNGYNVGGSLKHWIIKKEYNTSNYVAGDAIRLLEMYFNSDVASKLITPDAFQDFNVDKKTKVVVFTLANKILTDMRQKKRDITHSFYLKEFHLKVLNNEVKFNNIDTLILEEAQDCNLLQASIINHANVKQKLIVGDRDQSIYGWRGASNFFETLDDTWERTYLTKSFRCKPEVAEKADWLLRYFKQRKEKFVGFDREIPDEDNTHAFLSRTNSGLIKAIAKCYADAIPMKTTRDPNEIFSVITDISFIGNENYKPKNPYIKEVYKDYQTYKDENNKPNMTFIAFIEQRLDDDLDRELKIASKILLQLISNDISPLDLKKFAISMNDDKELIPDIILSTAHTSKGLEFRRVTLADDFPKISEIMFKIIKNEVTEELFDFVSHEMFQQMSIEQAQEVVFDFLNKIITDDWIYTTYVKNIQDHSRKDLQYHIEEINLLYVAITRAKEFVNFEVPDLYEIFADVRKEIVEYFL